MRTIYQLQDDIATLYVAVQEARKNVAAWKQEEKQRMKVVKQLMQVQEKLDPTFKGKEFLATLDDALAVETADNI